MDLITIGAGLIPLALEAGKALINKFIVPDTFKPTSVAEWLQMRASDLELFRTMNEAGTAGASYPWVEAIVRLQRPLVCAVVLLTWSYAHGVAEWADTQSIDNFASAVGFYLFGDRSLFYVKQATVKK